jgi:hypothetical protein
MNQEFYHREREVKQYEERQRAQAEKHQTLETVHIEQNAAQAGISSPVSGQESSPQPGFFARLKKAILGK